MISRADKGLNGFRSDLAEFLSILEEKLLKIDSNLLFCLMVKLIEY